MNKDWKFDENYEKAFAFNQGSDARIAGHSISINPYRNGTIQCIYYCAGWNDVDKNWGKWVRGRWTFKPLPVIGQRNGHSVSIFPV